jgi:hypothetical protein
VWLFLGRVARRGLWPERTTHLNDTILPTVDNGTTLENGKALAAYRELARPRPLVVAHFLLCLDSKTSAGSWTL